VDQRKDLSNSIAYASSGGIFLQAISWLLVETRRALKQNRPSCIQMHVGDSRIRTRHHFSEPGVISTQRLPNAIIFGHLGNVGSIQAAKVDGRRVNAAESKNFEILQRTQGMICLCHPQLRARIRTAGVMLSISCTVKGMYTQLSEKSKLSLISKRHVTQQFCHYICV
jgi:hypothetical protein